MTHEAVTRSTRLTRTVLQSLEEDRFGDIAAPVYVRGFLRIYAQCLEMDADQLLEAYEQQIAVQTEEPMAMTGAVNLPEYLRSSTKPVRSLSPAQLFLLVGTAAIVVAFMWNVSRKRPIQMANRPALQAAPATATGPTALDPDVRTPVRKPEPARSPKH